MAIMLSRKCSPKITVLYVKGKGDGWGGGGGVLGVTGTPPPP